MQEFVDSGWAEAGPEKCMGCAVCALGSPEEALKLRRVERARAFSWSRDLYQTVVQENKG